ncbi:HNH endonuclease [bacterium]|nr:HNH endonuclease [bacterium]
MWLLLDGFRDLEMRWLFALGRAMAIAQNFEQNCKYITQITDLDKEYARGGIKDIEDMRAYSERLLKKLQGVGVALHRLRSNIKIGSGEDEILRLACNARNYFAHEGAKPCICFGSAKDILEKIPQFEEHVRNLSRGDNLVSGWVYEISEKEPAQRTSIHDTYVNAIVEWVLTPFREPSMDTEWRIVQEECGMSFGGVVRVKALLVRAKQQCECERSSHVHIHKGRCQAKSKLEYHHRIPKEKGGDNSFENCEVLCEVCHKHVHGFEGNASSDMI